MTRAIRIFDASVIVKLCVEETGSVEARSLVETGAPIATPDHALTEVSEALTRKVCRGEATFDQTLSALEALAAEFEFVPVAGLVASAMATSLETGASVYDCRYVSAANLKDCKLVTADKRLISRLSGTRYAPLLLPLDSFSGSP